MRITVEELEKQREEIEKRLGYVFKDKSLLFTAFVHSSFFNEQRDLVKEHNERLEFLGDSVLGLILSDFLYNFFPTRPEGELSHLRSQLVDASACAKYLQKLGLEAFVLLGKGEKLNEGRGRDKILADLLEALIGAIYLDGGLEMASQFFFRNFQEDLDTSLKAPLRNWKAELQDYAQRRYQKPPVYRVLAESGPDHHKVFEVAALIDQEIVGTGTGASKKEAEQAAAQNAIEKMHG